MAVQRTLANPTVTVNDQVIGIVPNSCSYKPGLGDVNVRAQSAGGRSIDVVVTENAETMISSVTFSLYNTQANVGYVRDWQNNTTNGNTITLSDGSFVESFREMFVVTDPEVSLGADGSVEVVFNGRPSL
jgi:hypothetical protein